MRRFGGASGAFASAGVRAGLLAFAVLIAATGGAAAEGEQMLLPYQCSLDRGRVVLSLSSEKSYRIVGARASHAFTACAPSDPNRCRTWQIHKFDFVCAGQRVPWLSVAAALLDRAPHRGRIDAGRLRLRLEPQWQRRAVVPVGFRHPYGEAEAMLSFPAGFAPGLGSGVRFAGSATPPPTVVDLKPEPKPDIKADLKPKPEPRLIATAAPSAKPTGPNVSEGWAATVTPVPAEMPEEPANASYVARGLLGAAAVFVAWAGLMLVRRRAGPGAKSPSASSGSGPAPTEDMSSTVRIKDEAELCAELVARAVNLHQASRDAVAALTNANLRDILSNDLAAIQRRLLSDELTMDVAEERWSAVKPAVSKALFDLERIARIIAGVLSSRPAEAPEVVAPLVMAAAFPETADEAYEVLGVNPEASRTIVKKVVDGLRQSWHPDHARDPDDRVRREERMKQINAAWDLIRAANEPATVDAEKAA